MRRALGLALAWVALVGAAPQPRPLEPPPPDLALVIPFAEAPLEKPAIAIELALPPAPVELPAFPPATPIAPIADKPVAFIPSPRALPCVGAWLGIASESLECGRARFARGEFDDAAKALENAVRKGTERDLLREARYWLGETLWRLDRVEQADWLFRQVVQDGPRQDLGVWALHSSGWTALRLRQAARARDAFAQVLTGSAPAPLDAWARHGLALASYGLGRWPDAEKAWSELEARGIPTTLLRDVLFWRGDTLGRLGEPARGEIMLRQFVQGGAHPALPSGTLRLGWWALAAGHTPEALAAFRAYSGSAESEWASAGLALAQIAAGDWPAARATVAALRARRSSLASPMLFRLARAAADASRPADAEAVFQELLGGQLDPAARAWVLVVKGEADRAQGARDEARTQFELAQRVGAATPVGPQASVRLARANFELREYKQAMADLAPVVNGRVPQDVRLPALLLQGEAAYAAADYTAASAAFRRALVEFANDPQAPLARVALGWTYLKAGRPAEARRELMEVARATPSHPSAPDALLLAAELTLVAGDLAEGRELAERVIGSYSTHSRADFARLNRGLALLREGDAPAAEAALRDWLSRAPFPALFGRVHAALGTALLAQRKHDPAQREFTLAIKDGARTLGQLGLASLALAVGRRDEAEQGFTAVRTTGSPAEVAAAEYGLAAVAFSKGAVREFKAPAQAALGAVSSGPAGAARSAGLLYVLTGIAVEEKDWPGALALAKRLMTPGPGAEVAPDALERIGVGAAAVPVWPVVLESTALLRARYPQHPLAEAAWLRLAEAQIESGRAAEARPVLERYVSTSSGTGDAGRAWVALARARELTGDRSAALEAYSRAPQDATGPGSSREVLFGHARLLVQEKRWDAARTVLERLVRAGEPATVAEAAQGIGETYTGEGDPLAAAEYFLTAAYVAPDTPAGRRGMLSAARAFVAAKQPEVAATAYRKLLAQSDLPSEIRQAARQELAALPKSAQ
jgi:tetratricopeptide (TPR) repeat protein